MNYFSIETLENCAICPSKAVAREGKSGFGYISKRFLKMK